MGGNDVKAWIIIAAVLAIVRIVIAFTSPPAGLSFAGTYEAIAHIFIGLLAGQAYMEAGDWRYKHRSPLTKWELFGMLCFVEVTAVLASKLYWST